MAAHRVGLPAALEKYVHRGWLCCGRCYAEHRRAGLSWMKAFKASRKCSVRP